MRKFEEVLKEMDLEYFGTGKHKITSDKLFEKEGSVFLDVRSNEEADSVAFPLKYQAEYIHIPTDEISVRILEVPKDRLVGVFCSSGIRAAIVYAFLKVNGYDDVRIIVGGYEAITSCLKPGQIWKALK